MERQGSLSGCHMRPSLRATAFVAGILGSWRLIGRARDEANIRALASHEGCSIEDARRLYVLARQEGFGAAHHAVFGDGRIDRGTGG
jgi:hypothetical protein